MGRKPLPAHLRKNNITISLSQWIIDDLKNIKGYNSIIEKLIIKYLKSRNIEKIDEQKS